MSGEYDDGYDIGSRAVARILTDLIEGMRAAAEMNPGSAHSRHIRAACDHAEKRMREVTGDD